MVSCTGISFSPLKKGFSWEIPFSVSNIQSYYKLVRKNYKKWLESVKFDLTLQLIPARPIGPKRYSFFSTQRRQ